MRVVDLFSKRRDEEARQGAEDVYQYDFISSQLQSQVKRIVGEAIGNSQYTGGYDLQDNPYYELIENVYCREVGIDCLSQDSHRGVMWALSSGETDRFLDILELACRVIDRYIRKLPSIEIQKWGIDLTPDEALAEINYRMRKAGLGFQYESGKIIRQDSAFTHDHIVKPALNLLSKPGFSGVQEEFLRAHASFRSGDYETSIIEAAKSFESMLKLVCERNKWKFNKGSRSSDLIKILKEKKFFPEYFDGSFDQLISTLNSGLPKIRNDSAAHGQGPDRRKTQSFLASYALNLAASKIVLLSEIDAARLVTQRSAVAS